MAAKLDKFYDGGAWAAEPQITAQIPLEKVVASVPPIKGMPPCADAYLTLVYSLVAIGVSPDLSARCALEVFRQMNKPSLSPGTLL